jgi:MSHA biogenesis protein MshI
VVLWRWKALSSGRKKSSENERAIMQFFKKKAKSNSRVGLIVASDQLALAHMGEVDGAPYLFDFERVALQSERDAGKALEKLVKDMGLENKQCSYVLNRKDYNLHLVEAPEVEASELRSAVRWKIKDLLDMKVEDAAIDVFQVPEDAYRGRQMVYVVASLKSKIQNIVNMVTQSGLELAVIDIPELVMRNLSSRYIDDENGVAFMDLRRNGSTMNITRKGELYLSRRINTQLEPEVMQSMEWAGLKDRLILEIQRSLDYYESQMGQKQISRIVIAQRQQDGAAMAEALNGSLNAQVTVLNLAEHLDSAVELSLEDQQVGMSAIGATLRSKKNSASAGKTEQEAA